MGKGVSLNPTTFTEGGGLIDNVDVTFKSCRFEMWDYNGAMATPAPALKIVLTTADGDDDSQYYSAGKASDWQVSKDGKSLEPVTEGKTLNKSSNLAILLNSIIEAGFPSDEIQDDISVFEGMEAHVVRIPEPKRTGLNRSPRADGKSYEKTVLVVDKIISLPGDAGKSAGKAEDASDDDLKGKVTATVLDLLAAKPKGYTKDELMAAVFKALKGDPDQRKASEMAYKDEYLSDGPWEFNGKKVTSAE